MKKINIEATDQNILNAIANDTLKRSEDVKEFIKMLDSIEQNVFIALDAQWGEGKTFFVRQIEMTLKYYNKQCFGKEVSAEEENAFNTNKILQKLEYELQHTYLPIYFNAWLYDNHNDPLMSLVLNILKKSDRIQDSETGKGIGERFTDLLSAISLTLGGEVAQVSFNSDGLIRAFEKKDILNEVKTVEEIRLIVKEILGDIIPENADKLILFIDELDRCKPSYAIEMLERIKHYFDDDRIIFVVSINKAQLIHTISNCYGNNFDSSGYLNKFFDLNISLPKANTDIYFTERNISCADNYWIKKFANDLQKIFHLSLRDTTIYFQKINLIYNKYKNRMGSDEWKILIFLAPILCVLELKDVSKRKCILNGEGFVLLKNIIMQSDNMKLYLNHLFSIKEGNIDAEIIIFGELEKIYEFTFLSKGNGWYSGVVDLYEDFREVCIRACNIY